MALYDADNEFELFDDNLDLWEIEGCDVGTSDVLLEDFLENCSAEVRETLITGYGQRQS